MWTGWPASDALGSSPRSPAYGCQPHRWFTSQLQALASSSDFRAGGTEFSMPTPGRLQHRPHLAAGASEHSSATREKAWHKNYITLLVTRTYCLAQETAQFYLAARMGREFGGKWIHVHIWLSSFAVHLKIITVMPQYKIKSFFFFKKKTT